MPFRPLLALLLLCATVACAPIVTHGPRPERGLQLTATGGIPYPMCGGMCEVTLFNQVGVGARYGQPAENGKLGYSVGGMWSLGFISSELDVYVQAPTAPEFAAGGGILLAPSHVMPYVQLGRMRANGSGLYTTQGVVWMPERPDVIWMDAETSVMVTPVYWAPTVAYRIARRRSAVHLYVSGALGTMGMRDEFRHPDEPPSPSSAPVRFIMGGISLEHTLSQPFQPTRRPR